MHAFKDGNNWVVFTKQLLPQINYEPVEGECNEFYVPAAWSDDEKLARFGLHVVAVDAIPDGKRIVSETLVDDGGSPRMARTFEDVPEVVPDRVSARKFRLQLIAEDEKAPGFRAAVLAWVASQGVAIQEVFEYSDEFYRNDAMLQAGFTALGFTEAQGNAFFIAAAKL